MHSIDAHIAAFKSFCHEPIFVACSGGIDSMVLLSALIKQGIQPHVLHVNYGLRGIDSDQDAEFIQAFCDRHHLPCTIHRATLGDKRNIQAKARSIRYQWFEEIAHAQNGIVLLAHHRDDQIETFFLQVARKSGVTGMACMPEVQPPFYRPLLSFGRAAITAYAQHNGIEWREDATNAGEFYQRNKLRHRWLSLMKSTSPSLEEDVLLLIRVFQENLHQIASETAPLLSRLYDQRVLHYCDYDAMSDEQRHWLFGHFGLGGKRLKHLKQLRDANPGKKITVEHATFSHICADRGFFSLQEKFYGFQLHQSIVHTLPSEFDKNHLYLDRAKIKGTLHLRPWQPNDKIASLGMSGTQSVADVLKDAGVSPAIKSHMHVLCDDEHLLWIPGIKVSRYGLATASTSEILCCSVTSAIQE